MNDRQRPSWNTFDEAYASVPPWDIGRPQHVYVDLAQTGQMRGSVLDVGCGTGEHALYFAQLGLDVWGVDSAPTAIKKAQEKSTERGITVTFRVADALKLQELGRTFDTAIDSGLFHVFSDEERLLFVASLASVLKPGGIYYLLCFSDQGDPGGPGPRRVSQAEIYETFSGGWSVNEIRATRFETTLHKEGAPAWFAAIMRL